MTLSIITNASCFDDAILPPGEPRHLGTPDLNDPAVILAHRVIEWVTAPIFVLITVYFQRVSGWLTH